MSLGTLGINTAVMTSYSQFWGGANSYVPLYGRRHVERGIGLLFNRDRVLREVALTLNGTAAGQTALATHMRVSAPAGLTQAEQLGGLRAIDTVTDISRVTTANDKAYMDFVIDKVAQANPSSYASDASGNGGGGKVGV